MAHTRPLDKLQGPLLPVEITVNRQLQDHLRSKRLPIPTAYQTMGLIDTGAGFSAMAPGIAKSLSLKQQGARPVMAAGSQAAVEYPVYYCGISLDVNEGFDIVLTEFEIKFDPRVKVLIGRDLLAHYYFVYDGPKSEFSLEFKRS